MKQSKVICHERIEILVNLLSSCVGDVVKEWCLAYCNIEFY